MATSTERRKTASIASLGIGNKAKSIASDLSGTTKSFFAWFDKDDGPFERRVISKLDLFILSYAFIGFWVMYIDRGMLANAYISGMREELNLVGNEFSQLNSIFQAGYCVSMIPATLFLTRFPAYYVIPTSILGWGIFTVLCFRAQSFGELAAYRLCIALLQGPYFCSIHYILGSWYRRDELVRRAGVFYVSSGVGTMTTGLLAARIYATLDGHLGYSGWRWMYLIASIMTFPIAIWGFFSLPGTPRDGKRWFFTEEEFGLARERMALQGRLDPKGGILSKDTLKRFLGRWHFWLLVPWNIQWLLGYLSMINGGPTLWLRSRPEYTTVQVNNFTAVSPSLGIIFIFVFSWIIDKGGRKAIVPLVSFACGLHFITKFAWIAFDSTSTEYKWFATALSYIEVSLSPINYSVANLACAADAEERAFVVSSMLAISTAFSAWVGIVAFPTLQAPRFFNGYIMEAVLQITYVSWTALIVWYSNREERLEQEKNAGDFQSAE
ncbi:major facilitator superfamily domain-containing protein [Stachybotrys elegans]|uniref:Major facilitator superfamily domain-containing protein n=1 Tax=Stachybotrys elegans TaxID=80388 RepID=A0A8K0T422_9HYPO|nr:major facilitator superfamily domain-containing protein [Stachybotrys elegans]